jgi:predicted nucleic acid-binding Zn ribbon protein
MNEPKITRCPTAACAPTSGAISASDRAALETHFRQRERRRLSRSEWKRRVMYSHWRNFNGWKPPNED